VERGRGALGADVLSPDAQAEVRGHDSGDLEREPQVRPDLVLFSVAIERWARRWARDAADGERRGDLFRPQSLYYQDVLLDLERAAADFRWSAAVQKNLVVGLLGHGLLEALDEHVLVLHEIAQNVAPGLVGRQRDATTAMTSRRREAESVRARFAAYLLGCAQRAEGIPRTLRTLQEVLEGTSPHDAGLEQFTIREVFQSLHVTSDVFESLHAAPKTWNIEHRGTPRPLDDREFYLLRLVVGELKQNDVDHGFGGSDDPARAPVVVIDDERVSLTFFFPDPEGASYERLIQKVYPKGLQSGVPAHHDPQRPSHGMGLYLASLAAAIVGWRLTMSEPQRSADASGSVGFVLVKVDGSPVLPPESLGGGRA
jgi:hypothetical protein